jgi:hypothetical protein
MLMGIKEFPAACVYFEGLSSKPEFVHRMPAGSGVIMDKESACINLRIY